MEAASGFFESLAEGAKKMAHVAAIQYQYHARELVFSLGKTRLFHYAARQHKVSSTPLLIIFATVNRPEILDLTAECSFLRELLDQGLDVYLLDWGYPDNNDKDVKFENYVTHLLPRAVEFILQKADVEKIDLLGICQGGVISLCYTLLHQHIARLVLISTPIDFQTTDNVIYQLVKNMRFNDLEMNNISGKWLTQFFINLRPFDLLGKKYLRFIDNLNDAAYTDKFLRIEKWLHDAPDQPAHAFKNLVENLYQQNQLIKGELVLAGQRVDLGQLHIPVLNVIAAEDEIVPPSASAALKRYIRPNLYQQETVPGGHIGIYVSEKVGKQLPKMLASWLRQNRG